MTGFDFGEKVYVAEDATFCGLSETRSSLAGEIAYVGSGPDSDGDHWLSVEPPDDYGDFAPGGRFGYAHRDYLSRVTDEDTNTEDTQEVVAAFDPAFPPHLRRVQAGWLVYFDSEDSVLFEEEIDALRHAVKNSGRVKPIYYGEAFTNYYDGEDQ